jgi:hypothetical protein
MTASSNENERSKVIALTQRLNDLERLLREGKVHLGASEEAIKKDLQRVRRDGNGLIIPETVSPALRALSLATSSAARMPSGEAASNNAPDVLNPVLAQRELFSLFEDLFIATVGKEHTRYGSDDEFRDDFLRRARSSPDEFDKKFSGAIEKLSSYYDRHMHRLFQEAKRIAGLKLVLGGQLQFLSSHLNGVRQMMLYSDTVLIPDPVYPFLEASTVENVAVPLQMAIAAFYLLKLKPLIDADLPYPAVFVFPSFERSLEEKDVVTQQGILGLAVRLVGTATGAKLESMADAAEFAVKHESEFMAAVTENRLFVPPGHAPDENIDAYAARDSYLAGIAGTRPESHIAALRSLPVGHLVLQGIIERVRPQYHLLENADSLYAQPMVALPVQWHYLERVTASTAKSLEGKGVLPKGSLAVYRGLQDPSLVWLGNVPIDALVNLRRDEANKDFRKRMSELTKELESASVSEIDRVARGVAHSLASLLNAHQKDIRDIEEKYDTKYRKTLTLSGGAGILTLAAPYLPILSEVFGASATATATATVAAGAVFKAYVNDKLDESAEKRKLRRSLLGVLASAKKKTEKA